MSYFLEYLSVTASEKRNGIRQDRIKQYSNIQIYKNDCLFQSFCCTLEVLLLYIIFEICYSANIYLFKVNNRNTRKGCEVCSKLTIKTSE